MYDQLRALFVPALIAAISVGLLLLARSIFFRILHRWAEKAGIRFEDIIVRSLKRPSVYWCIATGLYIGLSLSGVEERYILSINKAIYVVLIFSVTVVVANLSGRIYDSYIQRSTLQIPATGLVYAIVKGIILMIGILIILAVLGISVAPLVTALGVGGLAVALALQDTLSNLFAGIHILMEKSIRVGDFIRLETGQEGHVEDISWRTTRIKMLPNNMVVIPNNKLSQSVVTNYSLPEKRMSLQIPVKVDYSSDPDRIERILLDVVKSAAAEVAGLMAEPGPLVRLVPGFGDNALEFTVTCNVEEFVAQYPVQDEIRRRILRRFREEGIGLQPQQRAVYLVKEDLC